MRYEGKSAFVFVGVRTAGQPIDHTLPCSKEHPLTVQVPPGTATVECRTVWNGPLRTRTVEVEAGKAAELTLSDE